MWRRFFARKVLLKKKAWGCWLLKIAPSLSLSLSLAIIEHYISIQEEAVSRGRQSCESQTCRSFTVKSSQHGQVIRQVLPPRNMHSVHPFIKSFSLCDPFSAQTCWQVDPDSTNWTTQSSFPTTSTLHVLHSTRCFCDYPSHAQGN